MKVHSPIAPVAMASRPLGLADWRLYLASALFALANLLVPMALHTIPDAGQIFLPMFFFTLLAAWQFGLFAGLAVAVASPLLSHFLTGMPLAVMLPAILSIAVALALVAAILSARTRAVSLPGILVAIAAMQAAGFIVERIAGMPIEKSLTLLRMSIPGMLIMLFGTYLLLRAVNQLLDRANRADQSGKS